MPYSPLLLVYGLLALWIAAFAVFSRVWRRTQAGREWSEFRSRLDPSVRYTAITLQIVFLVLVGSAIDVIAIHYRRILHPGMAPEDGSALSTALIVIASYMLALVPAYLLTNFVWSLVPSMRKASTAAKGGLTAISFRSANLMLLAQSAVIVPVCLAQLYFGLAIR